MKRRTWILVGLVVALTGCGKTPTEVPASTTSTASAVTGAALDANSGDVKELGVSLYPGMENLIGVHPVTANAEGKLIAADYKSADPPEKIAAFYREQMNKEASSGAQFMESPAAAGMARFQLATESRGITVMIRPDGAGSIVGIQTLVRLK
jgi:hypothetical protein